MRKKRESQAPTMFTVEEMNKMYSKATPAQLEKIQEKVEAKLEKHTENLEDLKDRAVKLWNKTDHHETSAKELGKLLQDIRDIVGHGEFTTWWKKQKFTQARVSYCLRLAQGKVKPAKERLKQSLRTRILISVRQKLAELYKLCESGKAQEAKELFAGIKTEIENNIMSLGPKEKAHAASAGK